MKKITNVLILAIFAGGIILSACKKKKSDPDPDNGGGGGGTPACTTLLVKTVETDGSTYTDSTLYTYDASHRVVKIKYYSGGFYYKFDTVAYSSGTAINYVKTFNTSDLVNPTHTFTYTYSGSLISSIHEVSPPSEDDYDRVRTYTYSGSTLTTQSVVYTVGTPGDFDNISSIVFTNGNISSANIDNMMGAAATITNDLTAPNPYKGLNINPDEILDMFNANNATSAYANAAPASPFFTASFTYANGRVETMTDDGDVTTFTYQCF